MLLIGSGLTLHAQQEEAQLVIRHPLSAMFCVFSADGTRLVTIDGDGITRLWDAHSGEHLMTLSDTVNRMAWATFSPDGNSILLSGPHNTLQIWDIVEGGLAWSHESEWKRGIPTINSAFMMDGKRIVTAAGGDTSVRVIDIATGDEFRFQLPSGRIFRAFPSPISNTIVTVGQDSIMRFWSPEGVLLRSQRIYAQASAMQWSPDGRSLLASRFGARMDAVMFDTNGYPMRSLEGHTTIISSVGFSRNGLYAVTTDYAAVVRVYRIPQTSPYVRVREIVYPRSMRVAYAALSPDGTRVAVCPGDSTVSIFNVLPAGVEEIVTGGRQLAAHAFPNPASDRLSLELDLPAPGELRISLVDPLGREALTQSESSRGAGHYSTDLDLSAVGSGCYMLVVESGDARTTRPVLVIR